MSWNRITLDNASAAVKEQKNRFRTRYSKCVEGIYSTTNEPVFLWTSLARFTTKQDFQEIEDRLYAYLKSGARLLPLISAGVDRQGVAYVLARARKLEQVSIVARQHFAPGHLFWQMGMQVYKLHSRGLPFGDISEDSFLVDSVDRVYLCGIPAFGFPVPESTITPQIANFIAPETPSSEEFPFEADMFALGVYAHQVFARRPIPKAPNRQQFEEYLRIQTPNLMSLTENLPEWALEVTQGLLQWQPKDRLDIAKTVSASRSSISLRDRLLYVLADLKESRPVNFRTRNMSWFFALDQRMVVLFSILALFFLICFQLGFERFKNLREEWQGIDTDQSLANINSNIGKGEGSGFSFGSGTVDYQSAGELVKANPFRSEETSHSSGFGEELLAEIRKAASEEQSPELNRKSHSGVELPAASEKELLSIVKNSSEIPREKFLQAGRELVSRGELKLAPKMGLLALAHLNPAALTSERREALIRVIENAGKFREVEVLSRWSSPEAALVLAALTARSRTAELVTAAFSALISLDVETQPITNLLNLAKSKGLVFTIEEMRAIATVSLGALVETDARELAMQKLEKRFNRIELLLTLTELSPNSDQYDFCPQLTALE